MNYGDSRLPDRFWDKCIPEPNSGCWLWTAHLSWNGYGWFSFGYRKACAHRVAYTYLAGEIPAGLDLDHLCRNRCCCNPAHLEPVTRSENLRRGRNGDVIRMRAALITHCPKGHAYDAENTYRHPRNGGRGCLTCRRSASDAYNKRRAHGQV